MARKRSKTTKHWLSIPVPVRIFIAALVGAAAAYAIGHYLSWTYAPLIFWDVTVLIVSTGIWLSVRHMNPAETKKHATNEDPGRAVVDLILLFASLASLGGVLVLIMDAKNATGLMQALDIILGVLSVVASWTLVHLIYMLRYADLHFKGGDAIDFNSKEEPTYQDFAYVAFTIGMTYQVSDTAFKTSELRKTARQHALMSYVFGTAIIATVINTVAGLGK